METASLRIKFTPLFNNALKNGSKCCLEIVPQVSCVQNLDKISWKQEKDLIEYIIPMTYKIILKKREGLKKENYVLPVDEPELDKTYHSCVDLLPPSSMTTFDFASGDVSRIISDTFILGKISAKFDKTVDAGNSIKINVNQTQPNDFSKEPILKDIVHKQIVSVDDYEADNKTDNAIRHLMGDSYNPRLLDKYPLNKITNTENALTVCKVTETQSVETTTEISTRSRDDSKRKLSLSPICSINTHEYPFPDTAEKMPLNLVVDRIFEYETNTFSESVAYNLPTRSEKYVNIKTVNDCNKESVDNFYTTLKRELPETRVAKFIKKMENEIMPLKMMLNEILQKCSTLGLSKNKCISRNLVLYKTVPSCKNKVEKYCKTENQTKSNRVVYSIVFEGAMDNDSVVEQIVRSLSFEIEAIPQDNVIQLTTTTKSAPLNVKIRVRKKEEAGFKHGVLTLPKPDRPDSIPERVRLVSSDQTIMSFNVVMEADFQKPIKRPRKHFLGIFKPTMCLEAQSDEDDYAYLPSNTYKAKINEESTSKSDGALTKFTLAKNVDCDEISPLPKRNKDIFGKCKPGGCLDPPFGEDRHPYSPSNVKEQTTTSEHATEGTEQTTELTTESKSRNSSIFSNKFFNWKKKSSDDGALYNNVIKKETKTESVLDLYQAGSLQTSTTYNNSIMTYPPAFNSSEQLQIQEEKQRGSRIYNDSSKNSFNVHSGSYFTAPKKPINVLDKNITKIENDDISDLKFDTDLKISDDKNEIAQRQSFEDDEKRALRTKDSVTDVRGIEKYLIESSDFKNTNDSNQQVNDNIITNDTHVPFTYTERIESKNMPLKKDEGLKEPQTNDDLTSSKSETIREYQSENNEKPDDLLKLEDVTIKTKATNVDKIPLIKNVANNQESVSLNNPGLKTYNSTKNMSQVQIVDENKSVGDKSVMTIDAKHEMSIYDITFEENRDKKPILEIERNVLDDDLDDEKFKEIPTPIERDTPLEIMNIGGDDLQHLWKNESHPLKSDSEFQTQNDREFSKQINLFSENMKTLHELNGKGSFDQTSSISINDNNKFGNHNEIIEDKAQKLKDSSLNIIANEQDTEKQHERSVVVYLDSQTEVNVLQESIEPNGLFEDNASINIKEVNSVTSQKLDDISFQRQASTTSNDAISEKNKHTTDFPQYPLEESNELTQTKTPSPNVFVKTGQRTSSNNDDIKFGEPPVFEDSGNTTETMVTLEYVDDTNEFGQNKYHTEYYSDNGEVNSESDLIDHTTDDASKEPSLNENKNIQQLQDAIGDTETATQVADQNNAKNKNIKKLTFGDNLKVDSKKPEAVPEIIGFDSRFPDENSSSRSHPVAREPEQIFELTFNDNLKVDSKKLEAIPEIIGFDSRFPDENSLSRTQNSENNIAKPILVKFAIQSYVDDNNQVIIKSFDADNIPKRYPDDTVKITKRYVENDDIIQIPIDAENYVNIQIKTNKHRAINLMNGPKKDMDQKEKSGISIKRENDLNYIKRNVNLAEDIRKTLEAVYEKELLPLRNTISELKDNVDMLTTHHLLLKGNMFLKKPRSTKIVPLYRRCVCMMK